MITDQLDKLPSQSELVPLVPTCRSLILPVFTERASIVHRGIFRSSPFTWMTSDTGGGAEQYYLCICPSVMVMLILISDLAHDISDI